MNPNLLKKVLRGSENINGSKRFKEANNFRSPPNTVLTNFSLARNHSHDRSVSVMGSKNEHEKERGENEKSLKRRGKNGLNTKVCSRGHWRPSEDAKLKELVAQFGPQNWNLTAQHLLGRSGKSCRLRWFNQLDPRINKTSFTEEEEFRLLTAHRAYGNKWALISRFFPGRTDNAVKNHWHVIMARRSRGEGQQQRHQPPQTPSGNAEMTVSSSDRCTHGEFFGKVTKGSSVNEEDDDDNDQDGSAISTCTTELSLIPPSSAHHHYFLNYDNTLASGEDGQCVQIAEVNGKYSKKMDHQNHHTVTVSGRKMKSGFYFFDFLGVGAS